MAGIQGPSEKCKPCALGGRRARWLYELQVPSCFPVKRVGKLGQLASALPVGGEREKPRGRLPASRPGLIPLAPQPSEETWDPAKASRPPRAHTPVSGLSGGQSASGPPWGGTERSSEEEERSANPGGEGVCVCGGGRLEGERHAGHQPSSPLQLPPRISRNPQGKNSTPELAPDAPPPDLHPRSPRGPFTKHPSVQAPTSCPAPARRGALVRQGGGRPTAPQGGDRGPVLEQAPPHRSTGAARWPTRSCRSSPLAPPGGVSPKWGPQEAEGEPGPPAQAPSRARAEW